MLHAVRRRLNRLPLRVRLVLAATALLPFALSAVFLLVFLRFEAAVNAAIDADLRARITALQPLVLRGGPPALDSHAVEQVLAPQGAFAQVVDRRGRVLSASSPAVRRGLLTPRQASAAVDGGFKGEFGEIPAFAKRSRLLSRPLDRGRTALVAGRSLRGREGANESFVRSLLIGGPLSLVLAATACYLAARSALRPVDDMRRRAEQISAEDSAARLPVPVSDDEIGRLGRTLNQMLDRLQRAHDQQRVLVQNASHELRTPLATLNAELELVSRDPELSEVSRAAVLTAWSEAQHVARLAEDLLVLAQFDEQGLPLTPEPTDITDVLARVAGRFRQAAAAQGREVVLRDVVVVADADSPRLEQAVGNLVENAMRHGHGSITIELEDRPEDYVVTVRDEGCGIAPELADRVFERFARGGSGGPGTGLGLAIVAAIAEAHGGLATVGTDGMVQLRLPHVVNA